MAIIESDGKDIIRCTKCGKTIPAWRRYKDLGEARYNTFRGYCEDCDVYSFAEVWQMEDD